mmetsp:Transcript_35957/g.58623  ORF Transcript_35957/g.58623 Transcript_35957/m.58623 type:complete len:644 (+) Transcript_35957:393-2324(+)
MMPNFSPNVNAPDDRNGISGSKQDDASATTLPLPKVLTDLLLQTALLGIDTTAKLSKPTLELTKNTLLPHIILPLIQEIWGQYTPIRLQTWMKVVPTSWKNVGNLLWDTEAGQALGEKAGQLGEHVVDMASSDVARQCWIDVTIALIKLMEALHTPEVKALLDQFAVGACRFVDVLSSGKAKQVWFDGSDAVWALIEAGSDPVMVTSLAEGCAHICFALERERESLKQGRSKGSAAARGGGDSSAKVDRLIASKKRRERDRRQMETYPPGKRVVSGGVGRDGFEEALLDGLDGDIDMQEENQGDFEDKIYDNIDDMAGDEGPPQRVIVPMNSSENIGGDIGDQSKSAEVPFSNILNDADNNQDEAINPNVVNNDDSESEITTEIEDLRCDEDPLCNDDMHTQSSASEKPSPNRQDNAIAYEQDGNVDHAATLQNQIEQLDWRPHDDDDGIASEMYDTFEEPILQFYRRLNEVLVETRKQGKYDLQHLPRGDHRVKGDDKLEIDRDATSDAAADRGAISSPTTSPVVRALFGVRTKWWKLIIIASICGVATMCMLWFALGCYGFYVLLIGGGHAYHSPLMPPYTMQQPSNIVIQLVTSKSKEMIDACDANTNSKECLTNSDGVASISLDDWNKLKVDVDAIIDI